jgi:hypothetical protein
LNGAPSIAQGRLNSGMGVEECDATEAEQQQCSLDNNPTTIYLLQDLILKSPAML